MDGYKSKNSRRKSLLTGYSAPGINEKYEAPNEYASPDDNYKSPGAAYSAPNSEYSAPSPQYEAQVKY